MNVYVVWGVIQLTRQFIINYANYKDIKCYYPSTNHHSLLVCWQLILSQYYPCTIMLHASVHSSTAHWQLRSCVPCSGDSRCLASTGTYYSGNFPTRYLVWLTPSWPQTSKQPSSKNRLELLIILQTLNVSESQHTAQPGHIQLYLILYVTCLTDTTPIYLQVSDF